MIHSAPYRCPCCGAPAWREPREIEPPVDYCHGDAHGSREEYLEECYEDALGGALMMTRDHCRWALAALVGLVGGLAWSVQAEMLPRMPLTDRPALEVLADHGGEPARPYFVAIGMADVPEEQGYAPDSRAPVAFSEADMLPVTSERLSPGEVRFRPLELPGRMTPFFLVGDDALSLRWLKARGDVLRELNAVGLIVAVATPEGLERLREAAPGLELRPTPGDDLAGRLGLAHYPVLVTAQGLEQ